MRIGSLRPSLLSAICGVIFGASAAASWQAWLTRPGWAFTKLDTNAAVEAVPTAMLRTIANRLCELARTSRPQGFSDMPPKMVPLFYPGAIKFRSKNRFQTTVFVTAVQHSLAN